MHDCNLDALAYMECEYWQDSKLAGLGIEGRCVMPFPLGVGLFFRQPSGAKRNSEGSRVNLRMSDLSAL